MLTRIQVGNRSYCPCPIFEWLQFQDINLDEFCYEFYNWFFQLTKKKNTSLLQGIPNAGKSFVIHKIWEMFTVHTRLLQDGIFTFANLVSFDCAFWEELLILPDNVDTCKLVLEGQKNLSVVIKGQNSQKLNKRVPILITTNKDISTYCSAEAGALNVRCYKFFLS